MLKKIIKVITYTILGLSTSLGFAMSGQVQPTKTIRVGVTAGPHVEVMEFVKELAAAEGLNLKIIEFNDFVLPNAALAQGDLDVNCYQHQPFLDDQVKSRGYKLVSIGKTLLFPIGLYSRKVEDVRELKDKARIAIPNDPTNGGRALILLEREGLIKLKPGVGVGASILDIKENPKRFKIMEIEAPQLPRALDDVDAAVINTDWALLAGMTPSIDALALEATDSPYANVIVVQTKDKNNASYKRLVELYQSKATEKFVKKRFNGAVIPAWK